MSCTGGRCPCPSGAVDLPMSAYATLLFEKGDGVAHISLNRPHALNAYNIQMRDDFAEALAAVAEDGEIGALLITGQGRAFCAGADLSEFGAAPSQVIARRVRWQRDVWGQLNNLTKPVVTAAHGYCIGSGLEITLLSDLRLAAADTVFAMPEVHLGMIPAAGGSQTLPRNRNAAAALDLLLTGRRIGAEEALELGLITRIMPRSELLGAAWDLALNLVNQSGAPAGSATNGPIGPAIKSALRGGLDLTLPEGLELERRLALITL